MSDSAALDSELNYSITEIDIDMSVSFIAFDGHIAKPNGVDHE